MLALQMEADATHRYFGHPDGWTVLLPFFAPKAAGGLLRAHSHWLALGEHGSEPQNTQWRGREGKR